MIVRRRWAFLITLAWAPALVSGQGYYEDERDDGRSGARDDEQVLFFTPGIINNVINRITDEMGRHYGFDDDQVWNARDVLKSQFPDWFMNHRREIVPLMNEYVEMICDDEPPTPERVAEWVSRVQPLANDFMVRVEESAEELRDFMTEEQQQILSGELAAINVAVGQMNRRFEVWKRGGFDWETEWPGSERFHREEVRRQQQLIDQQNQAREEVWGPGVSAEMLRDGEIVIAPEIEEPQGKGGGGASPNKDAWEIYVEDFIKRYDLDEAQQNQAHKILRAQLEDRADYLRRIDGRVRELQRAFSKAKTEEEKARLREQVDRLNTPLQRRFELLKERLDRIPTRKQREVAAMAELPAQASAGQSLGVESGAASSESADD